MEITTEQIKELRDQTGVSVMQCKKALEEAGGDMEKAAIILRKKSKEAAAKKADRDLGAGAVSAYIHGTNEVGAMVMLSCETDFVSKNEEFVALAREIAMHAAATNPQFISREDVTEDALTKAREVFEEEAADKPEEVRAKVVEGKLDAFVAEKVLLEQKFIKNPETSIQELVDSASQKFGERVEITSLSRFSVK